MNVNEMFIEEDYEIQCECDKVITCKPIASLAFNTKKYEGVFVVNDEDEVECMECYYNDFLSFYFSYMTYNTKVISEVLTVEYDEAQLQANIVCTILEASKIETHLWIFESREDYRLGLREEEFNLEKLLKEYNLFSGSKESFEVYKTLLEDWLDNGAVPLKDEEFPGKKTWNILNETANALTE